VEIIKISTPLLNEAKSVPTVDHINISMPIGNGIKQITKKLQQTENIIV